MADDYQPVHVRRDRYAVFKWEDGKPVGDPIWKNLTYAEALRISAAMREWQPDVNLGKTEGDSSLRRREG